MEQQLISALKNSGDDYRLSRIGTLKAMGLRRSKASLYALSKTITKLSEKGIVEKIGGHSICLNRDHRLNKKRVKSKITNVGGHSIALSTGQNCNEVTISSKDTDEKLQEVMFEMYEATYRSAGENLWFTTKEQLQSYACSVKTVCDKDTLLCYIMFQSRKRVNKISLVCHNGTKDGKKALINLLVQKLSQPGFVIEASGALSWVLRKNEVPFMSDLNEIMDILEVGVRNETISINENFNAEDKNTQHYTHEYYGSNHSLLFQNQETLFGIGGCTFKETEGQKNCDRECQSTA
mmetsp:Transcript_4384/g.6909  ORF Transcript_4384/g.6909 Transcript_4384/m.6909 type:complete len:293 (-) Transcript_4384:826-1704(-)